MATDSVPPLTGACAVWPLEPPPHAPRPITAAVATSRMRILGIDSSLSLSSRRSDDVLRVERVPQAITDEVDGDDGHEDGDAREDRRPGCDEHVGLRVLQHVSPAGRGWLDAETEEGQRTLGDDRRRNAQR